ncbi:fructosamine kinase family protein [Acidimangrovimonas pyrenivorans]|uniref:Fructosamine kinase family protein n=1 Tax=Acidimangrovimonas pyrenivorans TaxID=2030798 RepID=A0ABV7ABR4_9RHOB
MSGLAARLATVLGAPVSGLARIGGGDLSEVWQARDGDGRGIIVKRAAGARTEAVMLAAIEAAGCPVPRVLHGGSGLLVMERLPSGHRPGTAGWAGFGAAAATLHAATGPRYGWSENHAFGPVAIPNAAAPDWPAFWAERRLLAAPEALPAEIARRLDSLAARLPELLPQAPRPALLHGDLWIGNALFGPDGFSGLIDPACSWGDPEVDLAMLALFASPPPAFFDAYGPLPPGAAERVPLYQLWPALVHLRLFGAGYRDLVEGLLRAVGA